jgi:hypothetical protein
MQFGRITLFKQTIPARTLEERTLVEWTWQNMFQRIRTLVETDFCRMEFGRIYFLSKLDFGRTDSGRTELGRIQLETDLDRSRLV